MLASYLSLFNFSDPDKINIHRSIYILCVIKLVYTLNKHLIKWCEVWKMIMKASEMG